MFSRGILLSRRTAVLSPGRRKKRLHTGPGPNLICVEVKISNDIVSSATAQSLFITSYYLSSVRFIRAILILCSDGQNKDMNACRWTN